MGKYDNVWAKCPNPKCGYSNAFRSKSSKSLLKDYNLENCPDDILKCVNGDSRRCAICGTLYKIDVEERKSVLVNEFISGSCKGEKCSVCGRDATNKLEETIFHDDPNPIRHPFTAYVCKRHFLMVVGPESDE